MTEKLETVCECYGGPCDGIQFDPSRNWSRFPIEGCDHQIFIKDRRPGIHGFYVLNQTTPFQRGRKLVYLFDYLRT